MNSPQKEVVLKEKWQTQAETLISVNSRDDLRKVETLKEKICMNDWSNSLRSNVVCVYHEVNSSAR